MTLNHPRPAWHTNTRAALARVIREMKLGEVRIDPRSALRLERELITISGKNAEYFLLVNTRSSTHLDVVFVARRGHTDQYSSPDAVSDDAVVEALHRVGFDALEARPANVAPYASRLTSIAALPQLVAFDDVVCVVKER